MCLAAGLTQSGLGGGTFSLPEFIPPLWIPYDLEASFFSVSRSTTVATFEVSLVFVNVSPELSFRPVFHG